MPISNMPQIRAPKFVDEFKEFAIRGNVIDLAVGVIIGTSFGKIVSSAVSDVIMPPIAFLTGGVDLTDKFATLSGGSFETLEAAKASGAITVNYGIFLNEVIDFVIVAAVIFLMVKTINRIKREQPAATPDSKECPFCLSVVKKAARRCAECTSELAAA
jgi:large conductance mechanosensitive channel